MTRAIIFLVGMSGAGKTTYANKLLSENTSYLRVNRDTIRRSLVGDDLTKYYFRPDLNIIEKIVDKMTEEAVFNITLQNKGVIVDNTNLKMKYINNILDKVVDGEYLQSVWFHIFNTSLYDCKRRVMQRDKLDNVDYIEKQYDDFMNIVKQIENRYAGHILYI